MEYLTHPQIPVPISKVGLGTWAIGGAMWGGSDPATSRETIKLALDRGVTLIDTAPVYGFGLSERLIGETLQGGLRNRAVIATKFGLNWDGTTIWRDLHPKRILQELDDSLARLRTDCIDVYQIHWPCVMTPVDELAEVLNKIRASGKVRLLGVCNFDQAQILELKSYCKYDSFQFPLSLFEQSEVPVGMDSLATSAELPLAHSVLCRGLLSGKLYEGFSTGDVRTFDPKYKPENFRKYLAAIDRLKSLARESFSTEVINLSIRWILDKGAIALCGARRPEQLAHLAKNFGWRISPAGHSEIKRILDETIGIPIRPLFMRPRQDREGRLPR